MREHPIIFNGPMVRAILDGRKTQTRQVVKPQRPYGQPGDRLWVRETFMRQPHPSECGLTQEMIPKTWESACAAAGTIFYRADPNAEWLADGRPWTQSIRMPRWASRITLEITGLRVERLRDINGADAIAEGILRDGEGWRGSPRRPWFASPVGAFRSLWGSINCAGSWDANPWVWVIEFKRVEAANG